jgi:hypothetical protein
MADFAQEDLTGSTFHQVHLDAAAFREVSFRDARFEDVDLTGVVVSGAYLVDLELTGEFRNLVVNGIDVVPLVEAELDRRYPERPVMRPTDPAGFRVAWDTLERLWSETVGRARRLDPALLHERVDGEWSFIETQRHLVFATDAWINRALLGDPAPWHPLDLPHDDMPDEPSVPRDQEARPSLDEVLAVRAERQAVVRRVIEGLTDDQLAAATTPVTEPGYPESVSFPVQRCVGCIVDEEFWHRTYAERDLAVLEQRAG